MQLTSGKATAKRLLEGKVKTCSELLALTPEALARLLSPAVSSSPSGTPTQQNQKQQQQQQQQQLVLHAQQQPEQQQQQQEQQEQVEQKWLPWGVCPVSRSAAAHASRLRLLCTGDEKETVENSRLYTDSISAEDSYSNCCISSWARVRDEIVKLLRRLLQRHTETLHLSALVASNLKVSVASVSSKRPHNTLAAAAVAAAAAAAACVVVVAAACVPAAAAAFDAAAADTVSVLLLVPLLLLLLLLLLLQKLMLLLLSCCCFSPPAACTATAGLAAMVLIATTAAAAAAAAAAAGLRAPSGGRAAPLRCLGLCGLCW